MFGEVLKDISKIHLHQEDDTRLGPLAQEQQVAKADQVRQPATLGQKKRPDPIQQPTTPTSLPSSR